MNILVSKNKNLPTEPPDRIRLSSGLTRTDSNTYTKEELESAGYLIVQPMPVDEFKYSWDGTGWIRIMG